MNNSTASGSGPARILVLLAMGPGLLTGCGRNPTVPDDDVAPAASWSPTFDASQAGALSSVWGTGPDDVFVVGGTPQQGEAYHFDGTQWTMMALPQVALLVWTFGFAPDDVMAVGLDGGVVRYDGVAWTMLDSGTTEDLWGVWGPAPDDLWIVGGDVGAGLPVILHFDGTAFEEVDVPPNDRNATSLFKVWGIGNRTIAVGENGLVIELIAGTWVQVPAGAEANDDFVSLWGTRDDLIVTVGGRATARIATDHGSGWTTVRRSEVPGLNAVYMIRDELAIVGGALGYVGTLNPTTGELMAEESGTQLDIHATWDDGAGRTYGVGGQFRDPYQGIALVRTTDGTTVTAQIPVMAELDAAAEGLCAADEIRVAGQCVANEPPCSGLDSDRDGWPDACDNCAGIPNADQEDKDEDGVGNACERCPGFADGRDDDADGVPDGCDRCAGADDLADADADGVPDGCDLCAGDDRADADEDGVPDACDTCPGHDDGVDADDDGVADGCDLCAGGVDAADSDGDGVPNACDACAGHDDRRDADGDGIPDGCDECLSTVDSDADGAPDDCDTCPGFDDSLDSDADGVADGCDRCTGYADSADADSDGTPNGCDACPGFSDAADSDADGIPDGCDACPGGDDLADADADSVADACDACPGHDDAVDSDADGVPDGCDVCPGLDDHIDSNADGIPDGCCVEQADCPLGSDCVAGVCTPAPGPDLEINFGGDFGCLRGPLTPARDGQTLVLCEGNQGLADLYMTLRLTGFAPDVLTSVSYFFELDDSPCSGDAGCPDVFWVECINAHCSLFNGGSLLTEQEAEGVVVIPSTTAMFFLDAPLPYDGRSGTLRVRVQDMADSSLVVEKTVDMTAFASMRCTGEACPAGQTCVDVGEDSFCLPQ